MSKYVMKGIIVKRELLKLLKLNVLMDMCVHQASKVEKKWKVFHVHLVEYAKQVPNLVCRNIRIVLKI